MSARIGQKRPRGAGAEWEVAIGPSYWLIVINPRARNSAAVCGLIKSMRLGAVPLLFVSLLAPLSAQECPAIATVLPNATVAGALDSVNCRLTDGSAYMPYRLDLPVRGQIK